MTRLLTPCIGCRRPVPVGSGGRCQDCRSPARRARSTWTWTELSRQVRARGICARCGRHRPPAELDAGHIIAASRAPDLALDPRNVEAVCRDHCNLRGPIQR